MAVADNILTGELVIGSCLFSADDNPGLSYKPYTVPRFLGGGDGDENLDVLLERHKWYVVAFRRSPNYTWMVLNGKLKDHVRKFLKTSDLKSSANIVADNILTGELVIGSCLFSADDNPGLSYKPYTVPRFLGGGDGDENLDVLLERHKWYVVAFRRSPNYTWMVLNGKLKDHVRKFLKTSDLKSSANIGKILPL
ncbi:hypothetical protein ACET3Z_013954 [Daucus carota]